MPAAFEKPRMERLPRSVELKRSPDGTAEFVYVDERLLPGELRLESTRSWKEVVDAIKTLAVRGAPAIGVAGAAAIALWACNVGTARSASCGCGESRARFIEELASACEEVAEARPTAVNLSWGVKRIESIARAEAERVNVSEIMFNEVKRMEREDEAANRAMGAHGAALLPYGARVLTHCNAGSLATVFYGTALGVVYAAAEEGKIAHVYADETRPVGQGARLTAWELAQVGLPVTLICDNMAASLMASGKIDAVVVGADRIAANGDAANKIGTYGVAVLAKHHGIPFYVVAPTSTIDATCVSGADIPIEQRAASEVLLQSIAGVQVWNPAFDVTPANLISAIVTERGVFAPAGIMQALPSDVL